MQLFWKVWLALIATIVLGGLIGGPVGVIVGILIYIAVMQSIIAVCSMSTTLTNLISFLPKEGK